MPTAPSHRSALSPPVIWLIIGVHRRREHPRATPDNIDEGAEHQPMRHLQ